MFCTLKALAACFQLSGIYLNASAIYDDYRIVRYYEVVDSVELLHSLPANGLPGTLNPTSFGFRLHTERETVAQNPLGSVSVGYAVEFTKSWSANLSYSREWSTQTDFKSNRFAAGVTWRPFAR